MAQIIFLLHAIKKSPLLFLIFLFCIIASFRILQNTYWLQQSHYTYLSNSFLQGRLDLPIPLPNAVIGDVAFFKNKYYIYFGPVPAILLLPVVAFFSKPPSQHILGLIFICFDFFLLYKIAKKMGLKRHNSFWLSLFFIFGTIFSSLGLTNITSYQVQIIAVSFLILALYEFFHQRRWLLIGIFLAFAGATKSTLYLATIFFIVELLSSNFVQKKLNNILLLIIPILISVIFLGFYNFLRFENFFETGYSYQATMVSELQDATTKGLFSFQHIPGNLYVFLFKSPESLRINDINYVLKFPYLKADYWGMSIFFTSPLFLYIFLSKLKQKYVLNSWLTVLLMLIPTLTYFGIGIWQFGFRYAVDFYPFLFLILTSVFKNELPLMAKVLIIYSICFNFFFMLSIWGIYPFA